jgi:hypothetical protein
MVTFHLQPWYVDSFQLSAGKTGKDTLLGNHCRIGSRIADATECLYKDLTQEERGA